MAEWECKRCGKCCKFIVIPVQENVDMETETYLEAHGIAYNEGKLIIPARCKYLRVTGFGDYTCLIHDDKFANCRLGGEKECKEAQIQYEKIEEARQTSTETR